MPTPTPTACWIALPTWGRAESRATRYRRWLLDLEESSVHPSDLSPDDAPLECAVEHLEHWPSEGWVHTDPEAAVDAAVADAADPEYRPREAFEAVQIDVQDVANIYADAIAVAADREVSW